MAEKNITRRLNIFINGKQVELTLTNLRKEYAKAKAVLNRAPIGTKEWREAGKTVEMLGQELGKANEAQKRFYSAARRNKNLLKDGLGLFGIASGAVVAGNAINKAIGFAKDFINDSIQIAERAKGIDAAFNRLENAPRILKDVRRETAGLISDLDIKAAANQFKEFNLDIDKLPALLRFASTQAAKTGQNFEMMFTSLVEGLSKESKLRIDNLGISQKELNAELEKTPDFVTAVANIAERRLAETGNILQENGSQAQRWNATLENTKERIGKLVTESGLTSWLQKVGAATLESVFPSRTLREEFEAQAEKVLALQKNLDPLVSEYEDLKSKSELTKDEQERLRTVIGQVADIVPSAVTEFDEYGNALDINTAKVNEFIDSQKSLLLFRNQEALKEQKEQLEDYRREVEKLTKALNRRDEEGNVIRRDQSINRAGVQSREVIVSDEELQEQRARLAELQTLVKGAQKSIEELSGDALDKYIKRQEEARKLELENAQRRARELGIQYENLTAIEIRALIRKQEALNEQQEVLDKKKAERDAEKAKRDAEAKKEREIKQRQQLQEALDAFEADRELQEELKKLSEENRAEAEEVAETERKFAKLAELANGEKELLAQLEEEKQLAIQDIRQKYRQQERDELEKQREEVLKKNAELANRLIDAEDELRDARANARQAGISAIRNLFKETEGVAKLLFALQKGLAVSDIISRTSSAIAVAMANEAKIPPFIPGPGGVPIPNVGKVLSSAATKKQILALKLGAAAEIANIVGTGLKGFELGGFTESAPTMTFDNRGKRVKGFVHDNEYVVPSFVRSDPEVPAIVNYLEKKRQDKIKGFETGGSVSTTKESSAGTDALAMAINRLVDEGVFANTYIGDDKILELAERMDELNRARENAIVA